MTKHQYTIVKWLLVFLCILNICSISIAVFNSISLRRISEKSTTKAMVAQIIIRSSNRLGYTVNIDNVKKVVHIVETSWGLFDFKDLDKFWVYAIFMVENPRFDNNLIGRKGEIGIGQLMPESIKYARRIMNDSTLNPFITEDNILMSLIVLELKCKSHNTIPKIISAYNGLVIKNNYMCDAYYKKVKMVRSILLQERNMMRLQKKVVI